MGLRSILLIILLFQIALNLTRPVLTLYASELGASTFDIGLLTAAYAFFPLIFAMKAGKIADKVGDRLPILSGLIGVVIGSFFPYIYHSIWSLYLSQFIIGISGVFIAVSSQNILGNISNSKNRDQYFSMFGMSVAGGQLIGPILGGYISEHFGYPITFLVALFISICPLMLINKIPVILKKSTTQTNSLKEAVILLKEPLLKKALIASALALYSKDIFVAYFPLFANERGISNSTIGWIIALQGLAVIIIRFIVPTLTKRFGRDRVLFMSIIVAGISFLSISISTQVFIFCILSCLMGFGLGCGQPITISITYNASPPDRTGEVLGLRLSSNRLSQLIAPIFFGIVGTWLGVVSVFIISGVFLIGGSFLVKSKNSSTLRENY